MTDPLAPRMRWWGWGVDGHDAPLRTAVTTLLRDELGAAGARVSPPALERFELPAPALPAGVEDRLTGVVGPGHLRDDLLTRVSHGAGRSYPDLLALRAGAGLTAPDAVVYPADHGEVARVLAICAGARVAVVPFGGGTSVVGGVAALRGGCVAAISLDLARMTGLAALDERSQLATFAAGTTGPEVERLLGERGLTLGHFPQSFEFSTIGGWAATRSAGQASTGYGRIDELVVALRAATPAGELATAPVPASAAGPDLRELLLGSEGVLGVITEVTVRVRPRAALERFDAYALPSFAAGGEALRELEQAGAAPDLVRLSDEEETRLSLALSVAPIAQRALRTYLRARGQRSGCLAIVGFDGPPDAVRARRARARAVLRRHGAVALGATPGNAWATGRFHGAYVRDELMSRGVLVETLETATSWTRLAQLHGAVGGALRGALGARGTPAAVMCHVSHLYPTGASLYFTFLARAEAGAELAQWRAAKTAAGDAIAAAGGTITHHHGVGRDHARWLTGEIGELGVAALRAVKERVDPAGIMNPGKLLP